MKQAPPKIYHSFNIIDHVYFGHLLCPKHGCRKLTVIKAVKIFGCAQWHMPFNPVFWEAEVGRLQVLAQFGQLGESLSHNKK